MFTPEKLSNKLRSLTHKRRFLVAYSGGMDSHVLLHSLVALREQYNLEVRAVHINHGLSENASAWVCHCKQVCQDLALDCVIQSVDVPAALALRPKHSPEAVARELRYQALAKLLTEDECLVTAHHADDQTETLLLQLLRGSGVKGLAAMPAEKDFMASLLLRPLLEFSRAELYEYAKVNKLNWIEDESNENIGVERNFIRHKLLPVLKERYPAVLKTTARSASHSAAASEMLTDLAAQDFLVARGSVDKTLSIKKLLQLSSARQDNLLRYWLDKLGFPTPNSIKLAHIKSDVLQCRSDANPIVSWKNVAVRRFRDDIYAIDTLAVTQKNLNLNFRKPGERCKIKGRKGRHALKKIFQELGIPPWQRDTTPLHYQDGELVAVGDHYFNPLLRGENDE
ncbi:MAG: tRNA lysidine(34) synthetase TilS [Gammaproteobacteria bacterium]|nr:tRNA lysidine(34) synthetase TilS [Gammaproteobacteria bacterium]